MESRQSLEDVVLEIVIETLSIFKVDEIIIK